MKQLFIILLGLVLIPNISAQSVAELEKLAGDKMSNGQFSEALDYYNQAITLIEDSSAHSITYAYAGMCAHELGEVNTAKQLFTKAVESGIEEPLIFDLLGDIGRKQDDYATQLMAYEAGVLRAPADKEKYQVKICTVYKKQKDGDKLLEVSEEILSYNPKSLKGLEYKGTALQYQKKMSDAEATFKELYALDKENVNANIFLGNYYYQVGRNKLASARKKYDKIEHPSRVQWHDLNESNKATMNKYYVPSIDHLEFVYAQNPNSSIKKMLYAMYKKMGDEEKAALYE